MLLQFALALLKIYNSKGLLAMATLENSLNLATPGKDNRQKKGGKSFTS